MPPKKSIEETFQKLSQIEHAKRKPGMYIGSTTSYTENTWRWDPVKSKMIFSNITFNPGLQKIYDEILMNATDRIHVEPTTDKIKIEVDKTSGEITITNNGEGIPVVIHKEHKVHIPSLIFGEMMTSTNYDDKETRISAGTHGLGAKLTNIFSKYFKVETVDSNEGKKFTQTWENNMDTVSKPKIVSFKGKPFTKITFIPDYERFGMSELSTGDYEMMWRRAFDAAAITPKNVTVSFNEFKIPTKTFESYVDLFVGDKKETERVIHECKRWEVIVVPSQNEQYHQVSFVNGVYTIHGGKHVDYIVSQITKGIVEKLKKKHKDSKIQESYVRESIWVFIKSEIENPSFSSQNKKKIADR